MRLIVSSPPEHPKGLFKVNLRSKKVILIETLG